MGGVSCPRGCLCLSILFACCVHISISIPSDCDVAPWINPLYFETLLSSATTGLGFGARLTSDQDNSGQACVNVPTNGSFDTFCHGGGLFSSTGSPEFALRRIPFSDASANETVQENATRLGLMLHQAVRFDRTIYLLGGTTYPYPLDAGEMSDLDKLYYFAIDVDDFPGAAASEPPLLFEPLADDVFNLFGHCAHAIPPSGSGLFIIGFGGFRYNLAPNDRAFVIQVDPSTNQGTVKAIQTQSGGIPGRGYFASAYSPPLKTLFVFGGSSDPDYFASSSLLQDLWSVYVDPGDLSLLQWREIEPSSGVPPPKLMGAFSTHTTQGIFTIHGGVDETLDTPLESYYYIPYTKSWMNGTSLIEPAAFAGGALAQMDEGSGAISTLGITIGGASGEPSLGNQGRIISALDAFEADLIPISLNVTSGPEFSSTVETDLSANANVYASAQATASLSVEYSIIAVEEISTNQSNFPTTSTALSVQGYHAPSALTCAPPGGTTTCTLQASGYVSPVPPGNGAWIESLNRISQDEEECTAGQLALVQGGVKWSFSIFDYQWVDFTGLSTLEVSVRVAFNQTTSGVPTIVVDDDERIAYEFSSVDEQGGEWVSRVEFLRFAQYRDVASESTKSVNVTLSSATGTTAVFTLTFEYFQVSVHYDPSIQVLLAPTPSDGSNNDGDDGSDGGQAGGAGDDDADTALAGPVGGAVSAAVVVALLVCCACCTLALMVTLCVALGAAGSFASWRIRMKMKEEIRTREKYDMSSVAKQSSTEEDHSSASGA